MARPAYERVGKALQRAYKTAGLRQTDVAEALGVPQSTVSRWARGLMPIDLGYFPRIDQLCGQPTGYVLGLAGFIDPDRTVEALIAADPRFNDEQRGFLLRYIRFAVQESAADVR